MGTETAQVSAAPPPVRRPGRVAVDWLTTTDHKKIGASLPDHLVRASSWSAACWRW